MSVDRNPLDVCWAESQYKKAMYCDNNQAYFNLPLLFPAFLHAPHATWLARSGRTPRRQLCCLVSRTRRVRRAKSGGRQGGQPPEAGMERASSAGGLSESGRASKLGLTNLLRRREVCLSHYPRRLTLV